MYTLGPLIHNPVVLQNLQDCGIRVLEEGAPLPEDSTVIIRAHGVPPDLQAALARRAVRVLDATCPHVKLSQTKARSFAEKGYHLFLAGEENHGEVTGIRGYVESVPGAPPCYVAGNPDDAGRAAAEVFRLRPGAKTALMGQTTISPGEYRAIEQALKQVFPALETADTICGATALRQQALRELCGQVDAVIIAGGRESANTRRLLSLAVELGKPAWLVQTPQEIPAEIGMYGTAGLSAGASTPDGLITEIEDALKAV